MTSYQIALMNPIGQHLFDRSIDRLFQDAVSASESQGASWTPPCNVREDEQGFGVQLALPGWEPQDVTLEVTNQVLSIKGERQAASASVGPLMCTRLRTADLCACSNCRASLIHNRPFIVIGGLSGGRPQGGRLLSFRS